MPVNRRVRSTRLVVVTLMTLFGAGVAMTVQAGEAAAVPATRYVSAANGDNTDNDCTDVHHPCRDIQYAVDQANAGDTVSVDIGTYDESVHIRKSLTLAGAGATGTGRTTIDGPTEGTAPSIFIDGVDTSGPVVVTVHDIDVSGNTGDDGILVVDATANIETCVVSQNNYNGVDLDTDGGDGGVAHISGSLLANNGAGVNGNGVLVNVGSATIDNSEIDGDGDGGVVVETGEASIDTSTLDGNTGAGLVLDGPGTQGTLTNSTISNTVPFTGRETPSPYGGGALSFGGTLDVSNSTLYGNTGQGVLSVGGRVTVDNSTVSATKALDEGPFPTGGIAVRGLIPLVAGKTHSVFAPKAKTAAASVKPASIEAPMTTLAGTVVADNTTLPDCSGDVTDGGYNLASDASCAFSQTGSKNNGKAKLGPLTDNGGPTDTAEPIKGSDAIDVIPAGSAGCVADATDQRGVSRPQGAKCDVGAVEVDQPPVVISPNTLPHGTVGVAYHQTITATGGLGAPYVWSLAAGTLPPGLTFTAGGVLSGTPTEAGTFHITVSVDDPTEKAYTIVIANPVLPNGASATTIANTGAKVRPLASTGALAIALGVFMLFTASGLGRYARRYRRVH